MAKIEFEIPQEKRAEVDRAKEEVGIGTDEEFVDWAVAMLLWAGREVKGGKVIGSVDERTGRYIEACLASLEEARRKYSANKNEVK